MAFEALRDRIKNQQSEMRNGDYLRDLVSDAADQIKELAPVNTGRMVKNITTPTPIREDEKGLRAGLGPRDKVGHAYAAPSGTIRAFLEANPKYRTEEDPDSFYSRRGAWWGLSREGQQALQEAREGGAFGGDPVRTPYFYVQEGSLDGWETSARRAGIRPFYFVSQALDAWREKAIPSMLAKFKARTGFR